MARKPYLLLILDGWGCREDPHDNAISLARTPVWDHLWADFPHALIETSGEAVGLPDGQMGNSEVGHMNLGAGRVVYQDFTRISRAIADGEFADNPALAGAIDAAVASGGTLHLAGLVSPGGVHSHQDHLFALIEMARARGAGRIAVHAFLDGRDTPPRSAEASLAALQERIDAGRGDARVASLIGRYYAMDRDKRWDRVQAAYRLLVDGHAEYRAGSAGEALALAYQRDENDEFVAATAIVPDGAEPVSMNDGDSLIFFNFRADRARELSQALTEPEFEGFERARRPRLAAFVVMTEYYQAIRARVAFPPLSLDNSLGEVIADAGLTQLRAAETEKYAHVTFFFNGGREAVFDAEERLLVPSPKVATYDLCPAMSAVELTDKLVEAIGKRRYDLIVCNYANPDMVGHTGDLQAAVAAAETIDACLGRLVEALRGVGGEMLLTADHGNLEQMSDPETGQPHTAHTNNPVPLVYVGRRAGLDSGALCDIAPTLLALMGLQQPAEMTGRSLLADAPA